MTMIMLSGMNWIEEEEEKRENFLGRIAEKNARQAERNKARIVREKKEFASLRSRIVPGQYNVFRWPEKLDIHKLNKLYQSDAERMDKYIIRCHGCGSELGGEEDFRQCSCGRQYSYREYRRSFRTNNMPTGADAKIFVTFIEDWESAKTYQEKMLLIDTLLHEFHLSMISGATHRPVAMNFIDGSRERVDQIISQLAEVK